MPIPYVQPPGYYAPPAPRPKNAIQVGDDFRLILNRSSFNRFSFMVVRIIGHGGITVTTDNLHDMDISGLCVAPKVTGICDPHSPKYDPPDRELAAKAYEARKAEGTPLWIRPK